MIQKNYWKCVFYPGDYIVTRTSLPLWDCSDRLHWLESVWEGVMGVMLALRSMGLSIFLSNQFKISFNINIFHPISLKSVRITFTQTQSVNVCQMIISKNNCWALRINFKLHILASTYWFYLITVFWEHFKKVKTFWSQFDSEIHSAPNHVIYFEKISLWFTNICKSELAPIVMTYKSELKPVWSSSSASRKENCK